ncbi:MAG: hypothetical protein WCO63_07450 [Bacteroidota bacterium]
MNSKALLLTVFMLIPFLFVEAQSKKDMEKDLAKAKLEKDSLQKVISKLSANIDSTGKVIVARKKVGDSIQKEVSIYEDMYKVLLEKVVKYKFAPDKISGIIDSIWLKKDSLQIITKAKFVVAKDSLRKSNLVKDSLTIEISHLHYVVAQCLGKGTIPMIQAQLNGTWTLNFQWYKIAEDSLQSGINILPSPADVHVAIQIVFIDAEMAEVTLSSGTAVKCFYKVNSFSNSKPYSIDLNRGSDINIRLNCNPTNYGELQVSYRKGNGYFSGYMRKITN